MKNMGIILDEMKKEIKDHYQLSDVSYHTWIEPMESISIAEDDIIEIQIRTTEEISQYVMKKWGDFIRSYLKEATGIECEIRFVMIQEDKKEEDDGVLEALTKLQKWAPLFPYDYNRNTYEAVKKFLDEAYQNPNANCLLTICDGSAEYDIGTMLYTIQNELLNENKKRFIYISGCGFGDLTVGFIRSGKGNIDGLPADWKKLIDSSQGMILVFLQDLIRTEGLTCIMCDVIEHYLANHKPVIIVTDLLNKDELLEYSKEYAALERVMSSSEFIQIDAPSRSDHIKWAEHFMDKYKIKTDAKFAKYYIAKNNLRIIEDICEAFRFYSKDTADETEYLMVSNNDLFETIHKVKTGKYFDDKYAAEHNTQYTND